MAAVSEFLSALNKIQWRNALKSYDKVIQKVASKKTKKGADKELLEFDRWMQTDLPQVLADRDPKCLSVEELVKLMQWKLSRGKFRPRLVDLAGSNSPLDVQSSTKKAFELVAKKKLKEAINTLSKLRGIGPATASAILAAGCPEDVGFMADEAVWGILGKQVLKYSVQEYLAYMEGVIKCRDSLREQDPSFGWGAHEVELCVWTVYQANQHNVELDLDSELDSLDGHHTTDDDDLAINGQEPEDSGESKENQEETVQEETVTEASTKPDRVISEEQSERTQAADEAKGKQKMNGESGSNGNQEVQMEASGDNKNDAAGEEASVTHKGSDTVEEQPTDKGETSKNEETGKKGGRGKRGPSKAKGSKGAKKTKK